MFYRRRWWSIQELWLGGTSVFSFVEKGFHDYAFGLLLRVLQYNSIFSVNGYICFTVFIQPVSPTNHFSPPIESNKYTRLKCRQEKQSFLFMLEVTSNEPGLIQDLNQQKPNCGVRQEKR